MKRLYLIIGSGCECGQGLLIFLVDDAFNIHNKLILLTRHETCSSQLSRRVIQTEPLPTCSLQEESMFVNTFKSSSYWFPQDSVYPFRLTSPLSIDKAVMVMEAERPVDAKSSTQDLPETEEVREVGTQVEPSNDSLEKAGETYCENSCDSELESIFETVTASAVVQCGESMLSRSIYNSTAAEQDTVSEVDRSSGQPLYANTEQLANAAFCSSDPSETATQRNGRTKNRNVVSGPKKALEHQLQISCSEDDRKEMEMWRTRYPFEPIEETEELLSKSDSTSTLKENEDTTHLVTSSTPGDEATLEDELFHFKGPSIETDVQPDCKKDNLNVLNVRAKSRRPRSFLSRSATWDGWMLEEAAAKMLCKRKQDVAVQTDSDDETAGNGSDIVIRTVL
ncbi:unnamed protein product [Dicrocoelium dendriticum]|nr:unnamed protein product [Dicrocoelium dendriticum]